MENVRQMAKATKKAIKNKIYDLALEIEFIHFEALTIAINQESNIPLRDENLMLNGYIVMLTELQRDNSLIGTTLLNTLLNVKESLWLHSKFNVIPNKHLTSVTLAIAHMKPTGDKYNQSSMTAYRINIGYMRRHGKPL